MVNNLLKHDVMRHDVMRDMGIHQKYHANIVNNDINKYYRFIYKMPYCLRNQIFKTFL